MSIVTEMVAGSDEDIKVIREYNPAFSTDSDECEESLRMYAIEQAELLYHWDLEEATAEIVQEYDEKGCRDILPYPTARSEYESESEYYHGLIQIVAYDLFLELWDLYRPEETNSVPAPTVQ